MAAINAGNIFGCSSTGSVHGYNRVGGLVGSNTGTIADCHAVVDTTAGGSKVGGLAGSGEGTITNCYATGTIVATGSYPGTGYSIGGLVGLNSGSITGSYATGDVQAAEYGGGLVGPSQAVRLKAPMPRAMWCVLEMLQEGLWD